VTDDVVVLRKFSTEVEARLAATVLEANGIPAQVLADTAGGTLPSIALIFPVRLLVRASDADLARELLDTPADPPHDVGRWVD
jgi:Putative prokaryotic signal transducing protein